MAVKNRCTVNSGMNRSETMHIAAFRRIGCSAVFRGNARNIPSTSLPAALLLKGGIINIKGR